MRRFHADHEGVLPDTNVLSLWKCDEAASASTLSDSSYAGSYHLIKKGAGAFTAQVGLFMSGLEGTPEVTEPVQTNLTLWVEADDTTYVNANGNTVWPDKGPYTFSSGTKTTCLTASGAVTMTNALNGINGVRFDANSNFVHERLTGDGAGAAQLDPVDSVTLFDASDAELTIQLLAKFPTGAAGFSSWMSLFFGGGEEVHLSNFFSASDLRFGDVGDEATLQAITADPLLVTYVRTGNTWNVYLENDFSTVVATKSYAFAPTTNDTMHLFGGGTAFTTYALLVYNAPLSSTDLNTNYSYLSGASRWGTW